MTDIDDAFAALDSAPEDKKPVRTAKKSDTAVEDAVAIDDLDAFFSALESVIDDSAWEMPAQREFTPYQLPKEYTWVPLEIVHADIKPRDIKIVVAVKDGNIVAVKPADIAEAVKNGAEEELREVTLDEFRLELQHKSDIYGDRGRSFLWNAPYTGVRMGFKNGVKRKGELGWNNFAGDRIIAATRVLPHGKEFGRAHLPALAEKMIGKNIMGRIKYNSKDYTNAEKVRDSRGEYIKYRINKNGTPAEVIVTGTSFISADGTELKPEQVVEHAGVRYIRDDTEMGDVLTESSVTTKTFDNIGDVAPVPSASPKTGEDERTIVVVRTDGKEAKAVVTWETVSQYANAPFKPNTKVQAVIGDDTVTASWMGTVWEETEEPHAVRVDADGALEFVTAEGGLDTFTP